MYKLASYFNQRLANVKTSYLKKLLAQRWRMKSLPSDPGMKNTLMSKNACSGKNRQTASDSNLMPLGEWRFWRKWQSQKHVTGMLFF